MGKAESVTMYDEEFEELFRNVTQIKNNTEKILAQVDSMVQPNPGEKWILQERGQQKATLIGHTCIETHTCVFI